MAMQFEFAVAALPDGRWVITTSGATRDPICLVGVYVSEQAAHDALPQTAAKFLEFYALPRVQAVKHEFYRAAAK